MALEKFKKIVTGVANTTVKKAGEQVQITKLDLERSTIEREIKDIYTDIGRHCYAQMKEGAAFDEYVAERCADVDERAKKIVALETRIAAHKLERDTAEYGPIFADDPEIEVEVVYGEGEGSELHFEDDSSENEEDTAAEEAACGEETQCEDTCCTPCEEEAPCEEACGCDAGAEREENND